MLRDSVYWHAQYAFYANVQLSKTASVVQHPSRNILSSSVFRAIDLTANTVLTLTVQSLASWATCRDKHI